MQIPPPTPPPKTHPSPRPALAAFCAVAFLAGCATEPESHLVSAPPPPAPNTAIIVAPAVTTTQTTQTTQTTPAGTVVTTQSTPVNTIVVTQLAPPALQAEIVTARPSSDYGWVAGSWTWRNNRYEWLAGRWEKPPYSGARWNASRRESENGAYRFYEGYWN